MTHFSEGEISKQESLTKERLDLLRSVSDHDVLCRPKGSLVQLMHWVKNKYTEESNDFDIFIHNKISIDGSFIKFCEDNSVKIVCLHNDAITSWSTQQNDEHFMGMGIYRITTNNCSFLHCSLFHKGNQNEDEVSFFVIVHKDSYENYLKFRDDFVAWQKKRERDNLEIEVIGGDPIPYTTDISWDDLFLEESVKEQIKNSVERFINSRELYHKLKVPWRNSMIFWGPPGNGKTSCIRVIMSQFKQLKPVTIQSGHNSPDELLEEAFQYASDHAPSLLYFEDFQELIKTVERSHFLQLLDGIQSRDGILTVATGNNLSSLEENLKNRPRRFDRKFEFGLPNIELSKAYLKRYLKDIVSDKYISDISKQCVNKKFTFAHLQQIYINAANIALCENRDKPNEDDLKKSLKEVNEEKKVSDNDFVSKQRDLIDDEDE